MKMQALSGNPPRDPHYFLTAKLSTGEILKLADPRATRAMVALMDMQAVMGGAASHWGGPSAFAELMSALHGYTLHLATTQKKEWHELFHLVNDAGHCENGLYALKANYGWAGLNLEKLKGFRSIQSPLTGHGEHHLFPEGVFLSNGPLGSSLPQAQGLAMAEKLSGSNRVTVTSISDGACMEGEAREALAAIPGLAARGRLAPFVLIISDNNTKLSGRIDQEAFSLEGTFRGLKDLGWHHIELKEAHDLSRCLLTVEDAVKKALDDSRRPVALHARTIKGFGVKSTAESSSGGHGFPLKKPSELKGFLSEIYGGDPIPEEFLKWQTELEDLEKKPASKMRTPKICEGLKEEKVQTGISKAMVAARKAGLPVVSLSSDLAGSTGTAGFQKEFPQFSQDLGVAESNMVSAAAGFSKLGFIPVVDTFSQFAVTKGALPFTMASLSAAPLVGVLSHVGFQDAADGASHQALSYFSMVSSLPGVECHALTSSEEAESLFSQALKDFHEQKQKGLEPPTRLFFLGRENFPQRYLPSGYSYRLGKAQVVRENPTGEKSVTIVAAGALLGQALMAAEELELRGMGSIVVNPSYVNRPDIETIASALEKTRGQLLTVEDHQVLGGMGALLIHALCQSKIKGRFHSLGVKGVFGQSAYTALELYQKHGLDHRGITQSTLEVFG